MTGEAWEPRSLEILGGATGHQFCFLLGSWLLLMPRWSGRGREMTTRTQDIIYLFVRSFVHSFVHSFIHSCVRSFIHSCIHSYLSPAGAHSGPWAGDTEHTRECPAQRAWDRGLGVGWKTTSWREA